MPQPLARTPRAIGFSGLRIPLDTAFSLFAPPPSTALSLVALSLAAWSLAPWMMLAQSWGVWCPGCKYPEHDGVIASGKRTAVKATTKGKILGAQSATRNARCVSQALYGRRIPWDSTSPTLMRNWNGRRPSYQGIGPSVWWSFSTAGWRSSWGHGNHGLTWGPFAANARET